MLSRGTSGDLAKRTFTGACGELEILGVGFGEGLEFVLELGFGEALCVGVGVALLFGSASFTGTPLSQTNFLFIFTQVNFLPL